MLKLTLNKADMMFAFDTDSYGVRIYLDTETGEIHHLEDAISEELNELLRDEDELDDLFSILDEKELTPYERDEFKLLIQIETDTHNRFRQIQAEPYTS